MSVHENKKSYMCSICDYVSSQKFDLKMHTQSVHDNYKLQKCSICDFNCSQKGNSKVHIESVHENKKSYVLNLQFQFFSKIQLRNT